MPFGMISAPELWQQRMHEVEEGLTCVEVIADYFLVCGFGDTNEEVETSTVTILFHRTPPPS